MRWLRVALPLGKFEPALCPRCRIFHFGTPAFFVGLGCPPPTAEV